MSGHEESEAETLVFLRDLVLVHDLLRWQFVRGEEERVKRKGYDIRK